MIVDDKKSEVIGMETTSFGLKVSGKAFKIISDSLYRHKKEAIIRELSTNALDAQKEAGVDKKFKLHLPTQLDPEFRLQDFGVGMDSSEIETTYTTVFESTKENSNDFIGALGLGSKSPFSYTDHLTITSIKNGVKYIYAIMLIDDIPSYSKILESPTDEKSGFEVKFQVKLEDIRSFYVAYQTVISAFNEKDQPDCNIEVDNKLTEIIGDVYRSNHYNHPTISVRMGSILYPIAEFISDNDISNCFRVIANRIVLDIPIGSVDIHPSREQLDYTNKTKEFLLDFIPKINKEIIKDIQEEADKQSTSRQAAIFLNSKGFPLDSFTYQGNEFTLKTDFNNLWEESKKRNLGYISVERANRLVAPRLEYNGVPGFVNRKFSKAILIIRTSPIAITRAVSHIGKTNQSASGIYVVCKTNHKLIGLFKRAFREDLKIITTCDKHLRDSIRQVKTKTNLIRVLKVTEWNKNSPTVKYMDIDPELTVIKKAFLGTIRGNQVEIKTSVASIQFDLKSYYKPDVELIREIVGDFYIVLGVKSHKGIEDQSVDLLNELFSGKYTQLEESQISIMNELGYNWDVKQINGNTRLNWQITNKIDEQCLYSKVLKDNPLLSFIIDESGKYSNSLSKIKKLMPQLKEMI